ncbi:MAG: DUF3099 domain-containing protein [Corynebacterium sp.]|nr:DUF3099 domain-containing protein [Corynebacterium sp.]
MSRGSEEEKQAGRAPRRFLRRRDRKQPVELITDARQSPLENWEHRKRVYAVLQGARIPFLLASGAAYVWWHNWILAAVLFVISVPLPWIAVVIANGVGEPHDSRRKQVYKPQVARDRAAFQQQLLASAPPHPELLPGESTHRLELDAPPSHMVIEHDEHFTSRS